MGDNFLMNCSSLNDAEKCYFEKEAKVTKNKIDYAHSVFDSACKNTNGKLSNENVSSKTNIAQVENTRTFLSSDKTLCQNAEKGFHEENDSVKKDLADNELSSEISNVKLSDNG